MLKSLVCRTAGRLLRLNRLTLCAAALGGAAAVPAFAQIGTGWTEYTTGTTIHIQENGNLEIYPYDGSQITITGSEGNGYYQKNGSVEIFHIYNSGCNRVERRILNDYTSGKRQFEGEVKVSTPTNDEAVHQIFGGVTNATAFMLRGFNTNGGELRKSTSTVVASGVYGLWTKVNTIHDADANTVTVYINGTNKGTFSDSGDATHYFKYGCYGTMSTSFAHVEWRYRKMFKK